MNLICVEDGIDSSKDAGKLMISVLSAIAEIERENIRTQTMAGRQYHSFRILCFRSSWMIMIRLRESWRYSWM